MVLEQTKLNIFENPKGQDWHKYNLAKTNEKRFFYFLLNELCETIPEPYHNGRGRKPVPVKDLVFISALKIYCGFSLRKIHHDTKDAASMGYIGHAPHFNKVSNFFNCKGTYDLLKKLLLVTSLPLKNLEDNFSLDSSGFGSYKYESWYKAKLSNDMKKTRNFIKGHICIGTRTNIICSAEVTHAYGSDVKNAPELLENLKEFNPTEVTADKAYGSHRVFQIIESLGAMPFIPFKENASDNKKAPEIWKRMFRYFENNKDKFMDVYHKRSNVETTFAMIKTRLGEFLKSKNHEAQRNELMMKFVVHNICCLIQEIFERNVHVNFKECLVKTVNLQGE